MSSKTIEINGVSLHYRDSGEQTLPSVVIMHGWGCNVDTVASIEAIFKGRMRTVNIDLPGHGKSSEPPSIWGVQDYRDLVAELIRHLGLKNPALLGHSFGGRVAILLASHTGVNPDGTVQSAALPEVSKVVLVDAAGIKPHRSLWKRCRMYFFKSMKHLLPLVLGSRHGAEAVERLRKKMGSADYSNSSPVMRGVMSRCVNEDLKYAMPDIKVPTLLVWGEEDTATPLSDAKTMERLIPDAGIVSFKGCGHYSFLDNPMGFRAVIEAFFKKELS